MDGMSVDVMYETAAGELWLADLRGTAQRWRFDPASGERGERSVFGPEQGIDADPDFGATLLQLDGELYAMAGTRACAPGRTASCRANWATSPAWSGRWSCS